MIGAEIHIEVGADVQTLAVQPTVAGVWLLSTFAGEKTLSTSEIYVPNVGASWLAGVVGTMLAPATRRIDPRAGTLADHIRAIAANPGPAATTELLCIALEVARMELTLDEIAADASQQAAIAEAISGTRARARRAVRRRTRLTAVP